MIWFANMMQTWFVKDMKIFDSVNPFLRIRKHTQKV